MPPSATSPPPSAPSYEGLTPDQLTTWHEKGYLVIPDALSPAETRALLLESERLLSSFSLHDHPMTRFSTGGEDNASPHVGDDYFLTSGDKIRFFFEDDAFDAHGNLTKPKEHAVNKFGHYLHHLNPSFRAASLTSRNAATARALGFTDPRLLQSMVICKQPEIGGRVPPHQDSSFLYTDPPSAVGFWYALEDCTASNGCLAFAAGSHRRSPVRSRFVRREDDSGTTFADNDGAQWPCGLDQEAEKLGGEEEEEYELGEVKAGSLILIHGNLLHTSGRNSSSKRRMIYTFHLIEGADSHVYDGRNWLQPPKEGFTALNDALSRDCAL